MLGRLTTDSRKSDKELTLNIKQAYLIFAFIVVASIALLYGVSPQWFATSFLGVADLDRNFAHILRAVTGLSIGTGLFWLFAALSNRHGPGCQSAGDGRNGQTLRPRRGPPRADDFARNSITDWYD